VVIVGRGAGIVLARQSQVLSVCITAPLEYRLRRVMQEKNEERDGALKLIEEMDTQRTRYIKQNYGIQWEDPQLYHLILDTETIGPEAASRIIGQAALELDKSVRGG